MNKQAKSIRPFIGAKDFAVSRSFYRALGFKEDVLSRELSLFSTSKIAFYLQDAYVQQWVDNTMIFVEVEDVAAFWESLQELALATSHPDAKLVPIREEAWGKECFVHDPAGNLWHFGEFYDK